MSNNILVDELIEIAGIVATIRICRHFKGGRVYVPETMHETHPLALVIGWDAAVEMSKRWGGERIAIPPESSAMLTARNLQIANSYRDGVTVAELSRDYGYSRSWILKIVDQAGIERRPE